METINEITYIKEVLAELTQKAIEIHIQNMTDFFNGQSHFEYKEVDDE